MALLKRKWKVLHSRCGLLDIDLAMRVLLQMETQPDMDVITIITGPEMGHVTTPIIMIERALVLLRKRNNLQKGGSLLSRIRKNLCDQNTSLLKNLKEKDELIEQSKLKNELRETCLRAEELECDLIMYQKCHKSTRRVLSLVAELMSLEKDKVHLRVNLDRAEEEGKLLSVEWHIGKGEQKYWRNETYKQQKPMQTRTAAPTGTHQQSNQTSANRYDELRWRKPGRGRLKCNVDASFSNSKNKLGIGICI
ncbi:hypothetical protein MTR_5g064760 [Medicago truncatula]|uniref:Uncharacterized protein n=1 Tax=Medicago truncatula TaxID=3880 RepID=G7KAI0_MEDTR|nr:hypothetical protein MTR_5g064760 [Medicago truncatula]